jgi:malonyl-CoA/methylmalonyl-CoA synthetase
MDTLPLIDHAEEHGDRVAIRSPEGAFTFHEILDASARIASRLLESRADLEEARVAFMVPPGFQHVAAQWGIWRAGGIAVPLALTHPPPELEHSVAEAGVATVLVHPDHEEMLRPIAECAGARCLRIGDAMAGEPARLPSISSRRRAMILFTSGTTGKPKGVVTTHANIQAQVEVLVDAWGWVADDRILSVLPLHHVHGIVNVVTCALWSGACCEFLRPFNAKGVWERFRRGDLTVFMAVPTIYARLIDAWQRATPADRRAMSAGCRRMRLMVSGSAALPVVTLEKWKLISRHVLLERYGMTEIGMALSNPYRGERIPGSVGRPLPGVDVRRVDENGAVVPPEVPGEIEVRGPGVFLEYWARPEETRAAFHDGWFSTGDVAVVKDGVHRILGRINVDIIKTGGYKVSALEIEEVLRGHDDIRECAVVGVADPEWGEKVAACLVPREGASPSLEELRVWAKGILAPYKVPKEMLLVGELPRNALGKVTKPAVKKFFAPG